MVEQNKKLKETKSLPTLPREEPEDAALHLEEMMIVRILPEVLVFYRNRVRSLAMLVTNSLTD